MKRCAVVHNIPEITERHTLTLICAYSPYIGNGSREKRKASDEYEEMDPGSRKPTLFMHLRSVFLPRTADGHFSTFVEIGMCRNRYASDYLIGFAGQIR